VRVAVIGGGIAGLAAAWELRDQAEVTVFEPDRLGGKILTTEFDGHLVDEGPDAFIARVPDALRLCREVGVEADLVSPAAGRAELWFDGRLRPIPAGLVLGVPRQLGGVLRSGILSPAGMARAGLDLVLPRGRPPATLTVRELVSGRFGAQVADRLVDPLVGGIHAGSTATLGAADVTPMIVAAAQRSRSLLLGLRGASPGESGPVFATLRGGLSQLVGAMMRRLQDQGTRFMSERVDTVAPAPDRQVGAPRPRPGGTGPDTDGVGGGGDDGVRRAHGAGRLQRLSGAPE
jgi:protoporphyrinogen/coproporphyrinogen III oxidase